MKTIAHIIAIIFVAKHEYKYKTFIAQYFIMYLRNTFA